MSKQTSTRIWGFFESLAFFGIYWTAPYFARCLMYIIHGAITLVSNYVNHQVFQQEEFINEITAIVNSSRIETMIIADIIIILFTAAIIYARGGKFGKYTCVKNVGILPLCYAAIAGFSTWYVSIFLLSSLLSGSQAMTDYGQHMQVFTNGPIIATFLLTALVAPITEEFLFRGALFTALSRFINKPMAIIVTSVVFAAAHGNLVQIMYALILGIMLGFIRSETGSVLPCIAFHLLFNATNYMNIGYQFPLWLMIVLCAVFYGLTLYNKGDCK